MSTAGLTSPIKASGPGAAIREKGSTIEDTKVGSLGKQLDVSKNSGFIPPNHPLKNRGFHYFHHPFWGYHYFWKHPVINGLHP